MTNATTEAPPAELVSTRPVKVSGLPTKGIFVLVGNPKSGKTTLAAAFPDSYVLELEPYGGDRVAGRIHDIDNVGLFRQVLMKVAKDDSVKTIVIDSIDKLAGWFGDEVAKTFGLNAITERKKGVDGFEVNGEFTKRMEGMVDFFKGCGKLVILIAHIKPAKTEQGVVITPAGINVRGASAALLLNEADIIGYAYKKLVGDSNRYYLSFQGGPFEAWGSRVDELQDKTLEIAKADPYRAFVAAFKTETATPAQRPPAKSQPARSAKSSKTTKGRKL